MVLLRLLALGLLHVLQADGDVRVHLAVVLDGVQIRELLQVEEHRLDVILKGFLKTQRPHPGSFTSTNLSLASLGAAA